MKMTDMTHEELYLLSDGLRALIDKVREDGKVGPLEELALQAMAAIASKAYIAYMERYNALCKLLDAAQPPPILKEVKCYWCGKPIDDVLTAVTEEVGDKREIFHPECLEKYRREASKHDTDWPPEAIAASHTYSQSGAEERLAAKDRPEIVCLCGSTRFKDEFVNQNYRLTLEGCIVLSVGCDTKSDDELKITDEQKVKLDALHKCKIDIADSILVLNVGGYVGSSTASEIIHTMDQGKLVNWMEPDKVLTREQCVNIVEVSG